jgi:hypothetical protein
MIWTYNLFGVRRLIESETKIIEYLLLIYFTFCVLLNKDIIIVEFEFLKSYCSINSSFLPEIPDTGHDMVNNGVAFHDLCHYMIGQYLINSKIDSNYQ